MYIHTFKEDNDFASSGCYANVSPFPGTANRTKDLAIANTAFDF